MPSGAKKRKAAKKKKGNQSNNPSTHTPGDEDVKHNDDIESDVGENSSPKSEDHQNTVIEEEEGKLPNLTSEQGLRIDSGGNHRDVEESVVQTVREFKIEDELDRKNASIERVSSRSSSSSSSSSYEDESRGIKDSQAESHVVLVDSATVADSLSVESHEAICNPPIAEAGDSVVEIIPIVDSEKTTVLNEQVEMNVHSAADISSAFIENGEEKLSSIEDNISPSMASVEPALQRKEEVIALSDANNGTTSGSMECVTQENEDRSRLSYNNAPIASADNGEEHVKEAVVTQPVLAPPFPVEKTSWKGCCGLFEVFSRSSA